VSAFIGDANHLVFAICQIWRSGSETLSKTTHNTLTPSGIHIACDTCKAYHVTGAGQAIPQKVRPKEPKANQSPFGFLGG
jgi:hypothetical protein